MIAVLLGLFIYLLLRNKPSDLGLKPVGAECEAAGTACAGADSSTAGTEVEKDGAGAGWKIFMVPGRCGSWFGLFCLWFSYIIYATFFSTSLVADKGISQGQAGSMWALVGLISIFSGVLWGAISIIGRKYTLCIIFALMAVSYLLFGLGGSILPLTFLLLSLLLPPGAFRWVAAACGDYVGQGWLLRHWAW